MHNSRLDLLTDYPFQRLTDLIAGIAPGAADPIIMSIGEPQHRPPAFVAEILARDAAGWGKYPPMNGTADFRAAAGGWAAKRFSAPGLDPERHLLPLSGTREGLFQLGQLVLDEKRADKNLVLLPNPFYQAYVAGAVMAGGQPVFVPATAETGFLPDFESLGQEVLDRTALAFFCSPANPQGSVADAARLDRLVALARKHDFLLVADECYSEIYHRTPPAGVLDSCTRLGGGFANVAVLHSLSKRSSVPGLRSGFVVADESLIKPFSRLRSYSCASVPTPILAASAALWRDEAHVDENRDRYRAKFDVADRILGGLPGYRRPEGGFFLWLDVGDGEAFTRELWRRSGIKLLPGGYLAKPGPDGSNPGEAYARVALVHDLPVIERALTAIRDLIDDRSVEVAAQ
jgi:N-succinyldiaminopimelate aminotransferase